MPAATVPVLVAMLMAMYADGPAPEIPDGRAGEEGMSDLEIWQAIADENGDPMGGMTFARAVLVDPRRVDALIQRRLLSKFFVLLSGARGDAPMQIMRDTYLLRNQGIRHDHGGITAMALAMDLQQSWVGTEQEPGYQAIFERALWPMAEGGRPEALAIQQALVDNRVEVFRAFRESAALALRAGMDSHSDDDVAAWEIMHGVIQAMWATVQRRFEALGLPLEQTEWALPEGEVVRMLPGGDRYGEVAADYFVSGHRAPGVDRAQWARSGGRFYGTAG